MWRTAHDTYLEERILSADPVELVQMLYQAGVAAVQDARRHLAEGRIQDRARSVSKACEILMELNASLDFERGGEMSVRLAQLYGYMHRRLVEGNFQQKDEPLAEVSELLNTLQEGWAEMKSSRRAPESAPTTHWMPAAYAEPELAHASGGWSF